MKERDWIKDYTVSVQMTTGRLKTKFKYGIHTVGPMFRDKGKEIQLKTTIKNAFWAASVSKTTSIVFYVISSGVSFDLPNFDKDDDNVVQKIVDRKVLVDSMVDYITDDKRKHIFDDNLSVTWGLKDMSKSPDQKVMHVTEPFTSHSYQSRYLHSYTTHYKRVNDMDASFLIGMRYLVTQ